MAEGNKGMCGKASTSRPHVVRDPGMYESFLHGNREIFDTLPSSLAGRIGKM